MFCHKCGNKVSDGAAFCHKCGVKIESVDTTPQMKDVAATTSGPRTVSAATTLIPPAAQNIQVDAPKKKKTKKLPLIIGAAVLAIVAIISIAANSGLMDDFIENQGNVTLTTSSGTETASLLETYTNKTEGFSFRYPSDWTVMEGTELYDTTLDDSAVVCLYAPEGFGSASNVLVNKTQADYSLFDYTKTDFEQVLAPIFDEVSVTDLSNIEIDGFSVIKLGLTIKEGTETFLVDRYYYIIGNFTYVMSGTTRQLAIDSDAPVIDAIMDSYTIAADDKSVAIGAGSPNAADVNYEGVLLSQLMHLTADEVVALLGPPEIHDEYKLAYETIEFALDGGRITYAESFNPEKFLLGGTPLAQNQSLLASLLGEPTKQGEGGSGYEMTFEQNGYVLTIATGDKDGAAWRIFISPNVESGTKSTAESEILYKGQPVVHLLGSTPEELNKIFGAPTGGTPVTGDYLFGEVAYHEYGEITFLFDYDGMVESITVAADAAEMNRTALSQNRAGIIDLLGTPGYEGEELHGEPVDYYFMEYTSYEEGMSISVNFPDANGKANYVTIAWYFGGFSDEEYQASDNYINDSFEWVETAKGNNDNSLGMAHVKGVVKNTSTKTYSYVQITFNLYDSSGNQIDTASATINNLKAGGTWRFDAVAFSGNVSRFEFSSIDAF